MRCRHCGCEIDRDSRFCTLCGGTQSDRQQFNDPAPVTDSMDETQVMTPGGYLNKSLKMPDVPDVAYIPDPSDVGLPYDERAWGPGAPARDYKPKSFSPFSAAGRLNRLKYAYVLLLDIIGMSLCVGGLTFAQIGGQRTLFLLPFYYLLLALLFAVRVVAIVKRFHDLGEPGTHFFYLFIPFYNIYIGLKLLFSDSSTGINVYGGYERNGHYWQIPLSMLLLPALYFGASLGLSAGDSLAAAIDPYAPGKYFYSEKYEVGITFPAGWSSDELDGFEAAAQSWNGLQAITLEVEPTQDLSFNEYNAAQRDMAVEIFSSKQTVAEQLDLSEAGISSLTCQWEDVAGMDFLVVDFRYRNYADTGSSNRHIFFMGIHEGKSIVVQMVLPTTVSNEDLEKALDSARSLRIGDAAKNLSPSRAP